MNLAPIISQYIGNHPGWQETAKETAISSPLQFLLTHFDEQIRITERTNHNQVTEAAAE